MPARINPIALYLFSLAATIGAYCLYANFAVPFVEGATNFIPPNVGMLDGGYVPPDLKKNIRHLFAEDSWELEPCKTLQTRQGIILCQDYLPHDDGQIDVFPFTMILGADKKDSTPTVIRCMQSARILFDGPLSFGAKDDGGSTKVERANLMGRVLVYRPPSTTGGDDAFQIVTSNLQIEKQLISTLENVEFQVGLHKGRGSNLTIELAQKEGSRELTSDFSSVEGIKSMRLANLNFLHVHPGKKSGKANRSTRRVFDNGAHPLEITCRGAFEFDLKHNEAEFLKEVVVQQSVAGGDSLKCDQLRLSFAGEALTNVDPMNPTKGQELEMERILAVGNPAVLNMRSKETRITGQQLQFKVDSGEVFATNQDGLVSVVNKEFRFESAEIMYRSAADNSIGDLDAKGRGQIIRKASEGHHGFSASWQDGLVIRTEAGKKLIALNGAANVAMENETSIAAEHIKFWLWPLLKKADGDPSIQKWEYLPSSLSANGSVQIESPELVGTARQLTANWPDIEQPLTNLYQRPVSLTKHTVRRQQFPDPQVQDLDTLKQQSTFPSTQLGAFGARQVVDPESAKSKFIFDGDFVVVGFSDHSSKPKVNDLRIDGNVSVIESKPGNSHPLKMEGSRLHMTPQGEDVYRIFVGGNTKELATIESESLHLHGNNIHLDQIANKLWVEGMGQMKLIAKESKLQEDPKRPPSNVDVVWQGGMIFDGQNIYFEKDVLLSSTQENENSSNRIGPRAAGSANTQLMRTRSHVLNVTLAKAVDLKELTQDQESNRPKPKTDIEIEEIVLLSALAPERQAFRLASHPIGKQPLTTIPIVIEVHSYDSDRKLVEKQRFVAPSARIRPEAGAISAKGPGLIVSHRKGQTKFGAAAARSSTNSGMLSYLRVNYDGGVEANSETEKLRIVGNVRGLFLPTRDWNASLDPDSTSSVPSGGGKLACEQIEIEKWQSRGAVEPTTEFIASGNAHMWGDLFEATADRVSYTDLNDMLIIEGTPRTDANLWHQKNAQASRTHMVAGKIWYRPSDQWTKFEKIKNASTRFENKRPAGSR